MVFNKNYFTYYRYFTDLNRPAVMYQEKAAFHFYAPLLPVLLAKALIRIPTVTSYHVLLLNAANEFGIWVYLILSPD